MKYAFLEESYQVNTPSIPYQPYSVAFAVDFRDVIVIQPAIRLHRKSSSLCSIVLAPALGSVKEAGYWDWIRDRVQGGGGVNRSPAKAGGGGVSWRVGELEWEAWMRVLDNAGFRTGHGYRQPLLRARPAPAHQSDVEAPPSSSSYGELDGDGPQAASAAHQRLEAMRREAVRLPIILLPSPPSPYALWFQEKTRWLNSPNVYQKVEFLESGTSEPKKITKVKVFRSKWERLT